MQQIKTYGYRWVVLLVFMLINALIQMNWILFAPITGDAATHFGVSVGLIGLLSTSFMIVYLVLSIPASYIIDTYGIRIGVGIGAALTGIFGMARGLAHDNYTAVCIAQFGLAAAQPFILNAMTKVATHWFPINERATANGLTALAQFIGIIVAMACTPYFFKAYGMHGMLLGYGVVSLIGAILFLALIREYPPTPAGNENDDERIAVFAGIKHIFGQRDMQLLLLLFFLALGMFNAITTWIEQILSPRGFSPEQAGIVGAVMMVGGIIGAGILPVLSDKFRTRKLFWLIAIIGSVPGLVGLTFGSGYALLLSSSFIFGFFLMSAAPIGYQYAAEMSYPAPESTSQGLIVLAGQISGIIFIVMMDLFKDPVSGSMRPFMLVFIVFSILLILLSLMLNESPRIRTEAEIVEEKIQELAQAES